MCQASVRLRALMPTAQISERASMFRRFRKLQHDVAIYSQDRFGDAASPVIDDISGYEGNLPGMKALLKKRPDIQRAVGAWFECGFSTIDSEGNTGPVPDSAFLLEFVGQIPTGSS